MLIMSYNKQNIYRSSFGEITVRFIYIDKQKAIFVSKEDIFGAIKSCMVDSTRLFAPAFLSDALAFFADSEDKQAAIVDVDTIGAVINAHTVSNLLNSLGDIHDVDRESLRESAFRIHTLFIWYISAFSRVTEDFGFDLMDTLNMLVKRLDRTKPAFIVNVSISDNVWVAECETLGLVTEADSYEELIERAWDITPELVELNGIDVDVNSIRLNFQQEQTFASIN